MTNFPQYKKLAVSDLIPYTRNSRTHSDEQVNKIAASIKEFGFLNPVIVDGENGIIAGHGRVLAAQKLGITEVPVVEASHLTDTQKRAYIIADNRLALDAGWDDEMLRVEFEELGEANFDLRITGFALDEIEILLEDAGFDENPIEPEFHDEIETETNFTIKCKNLDEYEEICIILNKSKRITAEEFKNVWFNR